MNRWTKQIRLESDKRLTQEYRDFGISALICNKTTKSITLGSLVVTNCKQIESFFCDREIELPKDFEYPVEKDRNTKQDCIKIVRAIFLLEKKLFQCWIWKVHLFNGY
jgi:hypothetical protein